MTSSSKQAGASAELARAASHALRTAAMSSALSEGIVAMAVEDVRLEVTPTRAAKVREDRGASFFARKRRQI
jgi:uncharacterized ferredoxin-like protein